MSFVKGGAVKVVFSLKVYVNVFPIFFIFSFIGTKLSEDLPQKFTQ
jgi:hypothetical protein